MKKRQMMMICALTIAACMATACGNSTEKETAKQTESVAETEAATEQERATETESESMPETAAETETAAPDETEKQAAAEPKTMYVLSDVYIRQAADASSEAVAVAYLGDEVTVYEEDEKWCKVTLGDKEGYVVKEYLSESREEAEQAKKSEEAARAKAEADAAAAAAQQSQSSGGGKYEVSRQAYDDCDGSGHGYYEITYSDGSTAIEEY